MLNMEQWNSTLGDVHRLICGFCGYRQSTRSLVLELPSTKTTSRYCDDFTVPKDHTLKVLFYR
jgi:hypothetical protein